MQDFYNGLAEILEIDVAQVTPQLRLGDHAWDSLAIISVIVRRSSSVMDGSAPGGCSTRLTSGCPGGPTVIQNMSL